MSSVRTGIGPMPELKGLSRVRRAAIAAVAATLSAGCSQTTSYNTAYDAARDGRLAPPPYHVAAEQGRKPELEDDGREAQLPPIRKARPEPDDPREPWSRNYGTVPPVRRADAGWAASVAGGGREPRELGPVVRGPLPADLPPAFRSRLASALDE